MIFHATELDGVYRLEPERLTDERGFFARTFCAEELAERGLVATIAQSSVSFNPHEGTLRGMHFQLAPHGETKLVRCTMGAIWDCLVDLRRDSPTFRSWIATELSAENRQSFYVPEGIAHGFITLAPDTEVFYEISVPYEPTAGRGVRWNDPTFGIEWPRSPSLISERDRTYPDFDVPQPDSPDAAS